MSPADNKSRAAHPAQCWLLQPGRSRQQQQIVVHNDLGRLGLLLPIDVTMIAVETAMTAAGAVEFRVSQGNEALVDLHNSVITLGHTINKEQNWAATAGSTSKLTQA